MAEPIKPGVVNPAVPNPTAQPVSEAQPVEQVATQTQPVQTVEPKVTEIVPEVGDRTKEQFEKLLDSNQRLFEANELMRQELTRRTQANQTFQPIQEPVQQQVNPQDFVEIDEYGQKTVNEEKLRNAINVLNQRATRAEQVVGNYIQTAEQREVERQNKEAYEAHPDLNPTSPEFKPGIAELVRGRIYDTLVRGQNVTFKEAADFVKSQLAQGIKPNTMEQVVAENKVTEEAGQATQEIKEQASLGAVSQPQAERTPQVYKLEELRELTRRDTGLEGNRAIAIRLQNVDHVRKASEEEA